MIDAMRKRKRQVLTEEEDIDEDDYQKAIQEFGADSAPSMKELQEDDTGPLCFFSFCYKIN